MKDEKAVLNENEAFAGALQALGASLPPMGKDRDILVYNVALRACLHVKLAPEGLLGENNVLAQDAALAALNAENEKLRAQVRDGVAADPSGKARIATLTSERDAALAQVATLTTERDALAASAGSVEAGVAAKIMQLGFIDNPMRMAAGKLVKSDAPLTTTQRCLAAKGLPTDTKVEIVSGPQE